MENPFGDRDFLLNPKNAVTAVSTLDEVSVSELAEPRSGQLTPSTKVEELEFRDFSDSVGDYRRLEFRNCTGAYKSTENPPYFDTYTSLGIVRKKGNEVLAIAGAVLVNGVVVVVQVQGVISKDVDFTTGLTYRQANCYLSGFDWRGTLVGAYEKVAEINGRRVAILPNERNRWSAINQQAQGHILSYNALAEQRGYQYDSKRQLFMKPKEKTKRSWVFKHKQDTVQEALTV